MLSGFKKILGHTYSPLNVIELSSKNLLSNYKYLSSLNPKIKVVPVLKSSAYGHGIREIGKILDQVGAPFFCVDSIYEGYELLKAGVKTPILIMGYIDPENLKVKRLPFSYAVYSREFTLKVNKYQPGAKIHIFVDTGMRREGIEVSDLEDFISFIKDKTTLKIDGLMSHFAMAEKPNNTQTKNQVKNFNHAKEVIERIGVPVRYFHFGASSGLLNNKKLGQIGNVARVGIATYGIGSSKLKPVLRLATKIIQVKTLEKGKSIGYDFIFTANKKMTVGILPIGYYDGVDRRLSNLGFVRIGKKYCRILGRVSMNITAIDLSSIPHPKVGQEAEVFGREGKNSILESAKICKTIPYELLIHLASSTKRVVS